jgi:hypothetical protein
MIRSSTAAKDSGLFREEHWEPIPDSRQIAKAAHCRRYGETDAGLNEAALH